ncbi:MAG: hypothetical protein SD837_15245 [Candidatus Electrothrix scaldis]|nr:MAG: hypothetical protein SD837_15245 [Candidatus Electrothrix sp. GW3-3]
MYSFSCVKAGQQGDELLSVRFPNGVEQKFHIWDYQFLYSHRDLYRCLIADFLQCGIYAAVEKAMLTFIPQNLPMRIADIACGSGLMGKRIRDCNRFIIEYLAGVEVTPEALTALERDTPGVYDTCFLLPEDDLSELKVKNINCLIICGAANHLTLKDYKYYLALLAKPSYVVFNLVEDPFHRRRQDILQWMNEQYILLNRQKYRHRKLLDGSSVQHELFTYSLL